MTINVVCTIDDQYTQHCAVMLSSLFFNNENHLFHVYIITDDSNTTSFHKLKTFLEKSKQQYSIIEIHKDILLKAPITHHISLATYFRLFIPEILPSNIDKVLFIDSDIVIRKSIETLWNIDIQNFSHAATIAAGMDDYPSHIFLSEESLYFNAGLMLINLKIWRELKILERGCELINQKPERLKWWDQDVLNILLHNSWLPIDLVWNAQPFIYEESLNNYKYQSRYEKFKYTEAKLDPAIVHFVGGGSAKPWHYACQHPFKDEYIRYLRTTPWKNSQLIGKPSLIARLRFQLGLGSKFRNLKHLVSRKFV
ncbi:glycosyltransferase family 8 protein [Nostoc sp. FACHB-87]|uniref:glycosyltransferase family 8 protein n=1 Tax=Nostocales TaxID=1161 RepID=UPI00168554F5|nr:MULTISPECIES: glycosyltransferase family 8 protein [Nostocales]MBD2452906.1 glycosyltransferase family 8 protein [Nostoc sp. FACHB-87]MBD2473837.1 glycosyltransferase family 8 protein [Anabaena sp. FACHB-83]MBD2491114.1 glycosyltransferase family 8 protein [Aulosira sp. FACHB-615]